MQACLTGTRTTVVVIFAADDNADWRVDEIAKVGSWHMIEAPQRLSNAFQHLALRLCSDASSSAAPQFRSWNYRRRRCDRHLFPSGQQEDRKRRPYPTDCR